MQEMKQMSICVLTKMLVKKLIDLKTFVDGIIHIQGMAVGCQGLTLGLKCSIKSIKNLFALLSLTQKEQ